MITKKDLEEATRCSNFMQDFKSMIWDRMNKDRFLPEKALDEIARRLFEKYIK